MEGQGRSHGATERSRVPGPERGAAPSPVRRAQARLQKPAATRFPEPERVGPPPVRQRPQPGPRPGSAPPKDPPRGKATSPCGFGSTPVSGEVRPGAGGAGSSKGSAEIGGDPGRGIAPLAGSARGGRGCALGGSRRRRGWLRASSGGPSPASPRESDHPSRRHLRSRKKSPLPATRQVHWPVERAGREVSTTPLAATLQVSIASIGTSASFPIRMPQAQANSRLLTSNARNPTYSKNHAHTTGASGVSRCLIWG